MTADEQKRAAGEAAADLVDAHTFVIGLGTGTTAVWFVKALARRFEGGGLSGHPVHAKVVEIVRFISLATKGKLPIIGCGGVLEPADAHRLMDNGASLVQIYTGLVYRGPFFARELAHALSWRHRECV